MLPCKQQHTKTTRRSSPSSGVTGPSMLPTPTPPRPQFAGCSAQFRPSSAQNGVCSTVVPNSNFDGPPFVPCSPPFKGGTWNGTTGTNDGTTEQHPDTDGGEPAAEPSPSAPLAALLCDLARRTLPRTGKQFAAHIQRGEWNEAQSLGIAARFFRQVSPAHAKHLRIGGACLAQTSAAVARPADRSFPSHGR